MAKYKPADEVLNMSNNISGKVVVITGASSGLGEATAPVGNWREETMTYFETDMPVTNAYTESINRLAKDKNREGRGYSFEVMRARMLYTTKHKKKAPTAKVSPFYKKTIGYGLPDFAEELNYGVDLSTI